ncbi:VQ motif-containing protein 18-like [Rhodamnia argentea]|uniref:VQ motif-containing protein 18-like n=1 Tax=Rhodamnia argentea TaxID=178133 RepID=A0ABM3GRG3_9MYRT|nr:VQ motif-containing protein 18-like [Rhodamnia argentea]
MEEMIFRKEAYIPNPSPSPPAMHRHSHAISKVNSKPKIRVIHIFAPEIIKTDVENFRELVQRLTGKPPSERDSVKDKQRRIAAKRARLRMAMAEKYSPSPPIAARVSWDAEDQEEEAQGRGGGLDCRARMKVEEEMRGGGGGELFGRPYEELGCYEEEFPLIAVDVSRMHAFEAAQLA